MSQSVPRTTSTVALITLDNQLLFDYFEFNLHNKFINANILTVNGICRVTVSEYFYSDLLITGVGLSLNVCLQLFS